MKDQVASDEIEQNRERLERRITRFQGFRSSGRVRKAAGPLLRATGNFSIGEICSISKTRQDAVLAEVVGFEGEEALLTPFGSLEGVSARSRIDPHKRRFEVPVGPELLGRLLSAVGTPIDGRRLEPCKEAYPSLAAAPDPMQRPVIDKPFPTGIRAIDGPLTLGEGQRIGVFAAAGGGKSTLMSMLVRFAAYDHCVVALIGERGREVREFVEYQLGAEGMAKSVLVIATSDRPAIEQVKAAYTATAIAEYFRDNGSRVLLLMDSLTRFARAQRQIGLSAGEPPTRRGFPPSVFELLPSLLERAGKTSAGSITSLYTVLVEGDDMTEPVADEVRSLLDGHLILSRKLAASGHYPAIDVLSSASRVFSAITDQTQQEAASQFRNMMAKYQEIELLLRVGEYVRGEDREADNAIAKQTAIRAFLRQNMHANAPFESTVETFKEQFGHA
ncbi:FliI/YscN family ATPase [uncultured Roseibium sp.]|uniref:FliI/YscN family ATPase n=1 Tax=uncultured Roseibium sp. TaxID=1936171 RepID=UPI002612B513|nr:FliI/YscN family ATPase [uncultured Roseibium sp.]